MTNAQFLRGSGFSLMAGAGLFVGYTVLRSVFTARPDPATVVLDGLWVPLNVLGVLGAVLVLLGLPAVAAVIARSGSMLGSIGLALLATSWMFFGLFLSLYGLLVLPWLTEKAPTLVAASAPPPAALVSVFIVSLLIWFAGAVFLATPFLRRRVQPLWVGWLLMASSVWAVIGNLVIAPSGPAANLTINLLSNMGPVLMLIALGALVDRTWSERDTAGGRQA